MSDTGPQVGPAYANSGTLYSCEVYESSVSEYLYRIETTKLDAGAPEMVEMKFNSLPMAKKFADTVASLATPADAQEMIGTYTKG